MGGNGLSRPGGTVGLFLRVWAILLTCEVQLGFRVALGCFVLVLAAFSGFVFSLTKGLLSSKTVIHHVLVRGVSLRVSG